MIPTERPPLVSEVSAWEIKILHISSCIGKYEEKGPQRRPRRRLEGNSSSQSKSHHSTESQTASLSWCQATIRVIDQFFFLLEIFLRQLRICYSMAPSLTRGRVCNRLLLLGLASAVLLGPESRGTEDHISLSQFFNLPQPEGPGPRIYIPQEQGGPVIPPGTGLPFRLLLRLAWLRWKYCNPPPHGLNDQ
jgi:hypothetical protein